MGELKSAKKTRKAEGINFHEDLGWGGAQI